MTHNWVLRKKNPFCISGHGAWVRYPIIHHDLDRVGWLRETLSPIFIRTASVHPRVDLINDCY